MLSFIYLFFCFSFLYSQTLGAPVIAYVTGNSHDDVGWLNTTQQYYEYDVRIMFDNTVAVLSKNSTRKFNYCEIAFFSMWWQDNRTTDDQRAALKQLLKNGQIEFASGGWVMNDEGNPTYSAIIDQLTEGHQYLLNELNFIPQTTWQIDPSGLTSAMPTIVHYAQMKGHLIDRISYDLREKLIKNQQLEFYWQPSPSLNYSIFTHILWDLYCEPYQEFNWATNTNNATYIEQKALELIHVILQRSQAFITNNVLIPWVCDFQFVNNAESNFYVMDQLIDWINAHPSYGVEIKYSLVSEYFDAVLNSGAKFPFLGATDFLPYHMVPNGWRTGFYTSRPQFKYNVRLSENILRSADSIVASNFMVNNDSSPISNVFALRRSTSEVQHHDAVVGTMRDFVLVSYDNDLSIGQEQAFEGSVEGLANLLKGSKGSSLPSLTANYTPLLDIQNGQTGVVVLYNSLGWTRTDFVKIPVNRNDLVVIDGTNSKLPFQILGAKEYNALGKYNLFVEVTIPPLGYETIFLVPTNSYPGIYTVDANQGVTMQSSFYTVTISNSTGRIESVTTASTNTSFDQNLLIYHSYEGSAMQMSDPYFMQVTSPAMSLSPNNPSNQFFSGPFVQELYQEFPSNESETSFAKQIIRLYNSPTKNSDSSNFIEIYHEIGVLPGNRELITQFSTSINSGSEWVTDENAYEYMKRTRNLEADQPIPANYYPSVYSSYIEDSNTRFTVVGDRTHSLSSQSSGSLQVMLHRRIVTCPCEIGQPLNDTDIATPTLRLILQPQTESSLNVHRQGYLINFPPSGFSSITSSATNWINSYTTSFSMLSGPLPENVHLLSFKILGSGSEFYILRFTHIFALGEDPVYSVPATVDIRALFSKFKITDFVETALTLNQGYVSTSLNVTLHCKEIKTFLIRFA